MSLQKKTSVDESTGEKTFGEYLLLQDADKLDNFNSDYEMFKKLSEVQCNMNEIVELVRQMFTQNDYLLSRTLQENYEIYKKNKSFIDNVVRGQSVDMDYIKRCHNKYQKLCEKILEKNNDDLQFFQNNYVKQY